MTSPHAHAVPARSPRARRLGALAAAALALALLGLGACSVDRRSDEYTRCKNPGDCPSRMCERGWCVLDSEPVPADAAPGVASDARPSSMPDAGPDPGCPAVCSTCDDETCIILCTGPEACPLPVTCPAGRPCVVDCMGTQACAAGVSCGDATFCDVSCQGIGACAFGVSCGAGACDIECFGSGACLDIECSQSCACDTDCDDGAVCGLQCPDRGSTCRRGGECDSLGCNTCEDDAEVSVRHGTP